MSREKLDEIAGEDWSIDHILCSTFVYDDRSCKQIMLAVMSVTYSFHCKYTVREIEFITKLICTYATRVLKLEVALNVNSRREDSSCNQSALPKILDEPPP